MAEPEETTEEREANDNIQQHHVHKITVHTGYIYPQVEMKFKACILPLSSRQTLTSKHENLRKREGGREREGGGGGEREKKLGDYIVKITLLPSLTS